MSKFTFAILLSIFASSSAHALNCTASSVINARLGSYYFYDLQIDRRATDLMPGMPVSVSISKKLVTAKYVSESVLILNKADGRLFGSIDSSELSVTFGRNEIKTQPGNTGVVLGGAARMSGTLKFANGRKAQITCTAD
ncbi:MAG: hypothetical protein AAB250_05100 [Bdellovibrionota bacterium]